MNDAQSEGKAGAGKLVAVLELFTSQGCSSCPPADALMQMYATFPDVVALTMPVDYWDYLGWKDTLASPKNSERQRQYAKTRGDGAVYTPQVVVNGRAHVNGTKRRDIESAIDRTRRDFLASQVAVVVSRDNGVLSVAIADAPAGVEVKDATVWLASVQRNGQVTIKKGENTGKTLTYANVVREMTPVGMWSGKAMSLRLAREAVVRSAEETCVILVQQGMTGPIYGAALLAP